MDKELETLAPEEAPATPRRPPKTAAQMKAWEKALATRKANAEKRRKEAEELTKADQKNLEEKVVRKAIAIKKKQIKAQAQIDEISDDDTPIEKVREVAKKVAQKQAAKPLFTFV
jgi:hypothetical protein